MRLSTLVFGMSSCVLLAACGPVQDATFVSDSAFSEESVELTVPAAETSSSAHDFDTADIVAYRDECTKEAAPANTTVRYDDTAQGYSIDFPFNESWGSAPYVTTAEAMHFGPPVFYTSAEGDCALEPAFTLKLLPKRGAEEARSAIVADYESHAVPTPPQGWGVDLIMVDRRAAVRWGIGEWVCPMPTLEIPGTTLNLQLSVSCRYPKTPQAAQDELEEIMRGITFTE